MLYATLILSNWYCDTSTKSIREMGVTCTILTFYRMWLVRIRSFIQARLWNFHLNQPYCRRQSHLCKKYHGRPATGAGSWAVRRSNCTWLFSRVWCWRLTFIGRTSKARDWLNSWQQHCLQSSAWVVAYCTVVHWPFIDFHRESPSLSDSFARISKVHCSLAWVGQFSLFLQ